MTTSVAHILCILCIPPVSLVTSQEEKADADFEMPQGVDVNYEEDDTEADTGDEVEPAAAPMEGPLDAADAEDADVDEVDSGTFL